MPPPKRLSSRLTASRRDIERGGERILLRERDEILRHLEGADSDHPCGLIKIGVSMHPRQRACEIRGRLLAVEPDEGGTLEEERHEQFGSERVSGEWFRPSVRLLLHVAEVAELERERAVEWRRAGWTLADELRALVGARGLEPSTACLKVTTPGHQDLDKVKAGRRVNAPGADTEDELHAST